MINIESPNPFLPPQEWLQPTKFERERDKKIDEVIITEAKRCADSFLKNSNSDAHKALETFREHRRFWTREDGLPHTSQDGLEKELSKHFNLTYGFDHIVDNFFRIIYRRLKGQEFLTEAEQDQVFKTYRNKFLDIVDQKLTELQNTDIS